MTPQGQFYARKTKAAANGFCRVGDVDVDSKRRRHDSRKRLVVGEDESDSKVLLQVLVDRDRISNLPQDVMHCIVERLSVHDAARTSVLSKQWRYIWGTNTHLVLDKLFFSQLISNKDEDAHRSVFSRAIEMIILAHIGPPVLSFNFYIPPKLGRQSPVPRWIEYFLSNGIRELELTNSDQKSAYEIPSGMFDCQELVELTLTTWILTPPLKFRSFTNLINVQLTDISITAEFSFGSQLRQLYLDRCTGIQHLGCQFTIGNNLAQFIIRSSEQIQWRWLQFTKLKEFGLEWTDANSNTWKSINLIKLLCIVPTITKLFLSGYTIEVLGPDPSMLKKGLAPKIENVDFLALINVEFYNLCQLSNFGCLLRCFPNLQNLVVMLEPGVNNLNPTMSTIKHYLESLHSTTMLLEQLRKVTIHFVVGTKTLLHFIKVLLASSPLLRVLSLFLSNEVDFHEEREKIRQELQQCTIKSIAVRIYIS